VITKLVVQEQAEKAKLNNAGGEEVMSKVGGKNAGLPFIAFLDVKGELIVNGRKPVAGKTEGDNIGHPFQPQEIEWFMTMLTKATPAMSATDRKTLEDWLKAQKK
jgi:hypothetical protein